MRSSDRPIVFITDLLGSNPFSRKARGLAPAFTELGVRFDAVYMDDLEHPAVSGLAREVGLGHVRAAYAVPRLARYFRSVRPRLAIVNSGQLGPSVVVAGRLTRTPVIPWEPTFTDLETNSVTRRMRVMMAAQQIAYPFASAIAAPSLDMVEWIREHRFVPAGRVHLLSNPVDGEAIRADAGPGRADPDGPLRMVAVGRLVEQKGYDLMVEAMALADPDLPEGWRLTILGREGPWLGNWKSRIEALIAERGLEGKVVLAGFADNPHVEMSRSHLFVHTARWEPFGNVLVEALALGVPVLATDCPGGPGEILGEGRHGRLVPPDDPAAIASALVDLVSDPRAMESLADGGPAAAARYTPEATARRIIELAGVVSGR